MIPIIYPPETLTGTDKTLPAHNGHGMMIDTIKCEVTEGLDGVFDLSMEYPINGYLSDKIVYNALIKVECNKPNPQFFRIWKIEKTTDRKIKIQAEHMTYRMNWEVIAEFGQVYGDFQMLINRIMDSAYTPSRFLVGGGDVETNVNFESTTPRYYKDLLMDVCKEYDLEFHIADNFNVNLYTVFSYDERPTSVRSGVNLIYFSEEVDNSEFITGYAPYIVVDGVTTRYTPYRKPGVNPNLEKLEIVDLRDFGFTDLVDITIINGFFASKINRLPDTPRITVSSKYINMDNVDVLCMPVQIIAPELQYEGIQRVIKRTYDVIKEKNISVEIGDPRKDLITFLAKG